MWTSQRWKVREVGKEGKIEERREGTEGRREGIEGRREGFKDALQRRG